MSVKLKPILYTPSGRAGEYANHGYALNLYNGCPHGCKYCYVPDIKHIDREKFHSSCTPQPNILERLKADLDRLGKLDEPIFLCFSCDPYPLGYNNVLTRDAITLIKSSENNVRILTKNGGDARFDFDLLDPNDEFGVTLTTLKKQWEPYASTPYQRIDAIVKAHVRGIKTWISFEPVIDPDETLSFMERMAPYANIFKIGKLNYHPLAKTIDWRKFAIEASTLATKLGVPFMLKADLRAFLKPGDIDL
ncbi:MAG: radical SAM protein [Dehalococcoidia bacterium]|jgi:DNA repair photolyase